jgi:murein DD-endopeptidase MepM/ murein hydrolase activator NlpD
MPDINAQIRRAARVAGVPVKLYESLILHGERSYQGWQRSPAGAFGPAQLMPGTASYLSRKYGINTNTYEGNLIGGAYYLKEQLQAFGGNARKAVAAYNAGAGAVRSGSLPSQTRTYVTNVLGNLRGPGPISTPVGGTAATVAGPDTFTPPSFALHSAAPPDLMPTLSDNLGRIAQGWDPTQVLSETAPSILQSWLQPSTLTRIPGVKIPGAPAVPGIPGEQRVNARGEVRTIHGLVSPVNGKLIGFPYQGTHTLGNWESDNAVDIATPVGTPIRAVADGVIGPQFGSLGSNNPRMAGLRVHVISRGNEFYYAHLSKFAPGIRPGTRVRRGQIIGYSGEANGVAHLHFASRKGNPVGMVRKH